MKSSSSLSLNSNTSSNTTVDTDSFEQKKQQIVKQDPKTIYECIRLYIPETILNF